MKIYEVRYQCEDTPTGFAYEYFNSKREAERQVKQMKRQHANETRKALEALAADTGDIYDQPPRWHADTIEMEVLNIQGTTREMVLWALRRHT